MLRELAAASPERLQRLVLVVLDQVVPQIKNAVVAAFTAVRAVSSSSLVNWRWTKRVFGVDVIRSRSEMSAADMSAGWPSGRSDNVRGAYQLGVGVDRRGALGHGTGHLLARQEESGSPARSPAVGSETPTTARRRCHEEPHPGRPRRTPVLASRGTEPAG